MLGQQTWIRWVIQPKGPNAEGKYTYLKFDKDEKGDYREEVEDVFAASHFVGREDAFDRLETLTDKDEFKITKLFFKQTAALFRTPRYDDRS